METPRNIKDIKYLIERAIWTDRKLPKVGHHRLNSLMGSLIASDQTEADIVDCLSLISVRERPTRQDVEDWWTVMDVWIQALNIAERDIVLKRCGGMGWKRIAYENNINRITAMRRFDRALKHIYHTFFAQ